MIAFCLFLCLYTEQSYLLLRALLAILLLVIDPPFFLCAFSSLEVSFRKFIILNLLSQLVLRLVHLFLW